MFIELHIFEGDKPTIVNLDTVKVIHLDNVSFGAYIEFSDSNSEMLHVSEQHYVIQKMLENVGLLVTFENSFNKN